MQFIQSNINNEYPFRYDLFEKEMNGLYDEFIDLYYEAYFALKSKNMYIAEKSILEARNIFSEHLSLVSLEGNYYFEINDIENSIERLSYIISIDNRNFSAYLNRANMHIRISELKKAYNDYHKCIEQDLDQEKRNNFGTDGRI